MFAHIQLTMLIRYIPAYTYKGMSSFQNHFDIIISRSKTPFNSFSFTKEKKKPLTIITDTNHNTVLLVIKGNQLKYYYKKKVFQTAADGIITKAYYVKVIFHCQK
jgi:hypothetical protein